MGDLVSYDELVTLFHNKFERVLKGVSFAFTDQCSIPHVNITEATVEKSLNRH